MPRPFLAQWATGRRRRGGQRLASEPQRRGKREPTGTGARGTSLKEGARGIFENGDFFWLFFSGIFSVNDRNTDNYKGSLREQIRHVMDG